ncbi:uncharacterized protein KNAG_0E00600 [Huiozyma naganishii CBS 8797]|uniref:PEX18/PEX21 C-terminal domain-containing protein n=1 Tax=Huiozyma naganishii (strain ATCC MYA-139 / BCRC 22969 / CBS 8797 / KCTC 17520 / NBRC 10181 / NCYC 3082 / Yp74L-3) TaxID=1071383 RepID=J7RLD2_HUIN7|nr:hypothetical protein KNAG_0E00600 [Kazachstania naganishii CBS 8797]CCK70328.1 hypothetical protein KNAG_0E00600 [Kazachstania naganishii CBS 8797]
MVYRCSYKLLLYVFITLAQHLIAPHSVFWTMPNKKGEYLVVGYEAQHLWNRCSATPGTRIPTNRDSTMDCSVNPLKELSTVDTILKSAADGRPRGRDQMGRLGPNNTNREHQFLTRGFGRVDHLEGPPAPIKDTPQLYPGAEVTRSEGWVDQFAQLNVNDGNKVERAWHPRGQPPLSQYNFGNVDIGFEERTYPMYAPTHSYAMHSMEPVTTCNTLDSEELDKEFEALEQQLRGSSGTPGIMREETVEFRDTARQIVSFSEESAHPTLASSKFIQLMRKVEQGSVDIEPDKKQLISKDDGSAIGPDFIEVDEV